MTDPTARPPLPSADRLRGMRRGIEKESLRVDATGHLALTPHPASLGSALAHPSITTDFSESQLELITAAHTSVESSLAELRRVHQFVCREIAPQRLWVSSMPCGLPADDQIPIGRYGSSHIGRAKSVYRTGLAHRYGRRMQTISGIHYNWSLPGLGNAEYMALIRNFRRHVFMLLVLFGASPALCRSFVENQEHGLETMGEGALYLPHATSLRMGRLGYQSDAQSTLAVSFNDLESYARPLQRAMTEPHPPYVAIGLAGPDGEYRQLATSLLQIENEFYGTIRPKRSIHRSERPLHALRERGIEYVEVRCMDLDPFEAVGISEPVMRFIDVFLLHCLLAPSAPDTPAEAEVLAHNQQLVATAGRRPGLRLARPDGRGEVALADWGQRLLDEMQPMAAALDGALGAAPGAALGAGPHAAALQAAQHSWQDLSRTPSARVLAALRADFGESFVAFGNAMSERARQEILGWPWDDAATAHFRQLADASIEDQRAREAADSAPFESYRQQYLAPEQLWPQGAPA